MEFTWFNFVTLGIGVLGCIPTGYFGRRDSKSRHALKRIGHLSSQCKSICSGLDSFEDDLIHNRIGANSARSVLKPIKSNLAALNGELEDIYNEYIKKDTKKKIN